MQVCKNPDFGYFMQMSDITCIKHRGSYMSVHVLLNLLNELGGGGGK